MQRSYVDGGGHRNSCTCQGSCAEIAVNVPHKGALRNVSELRQSRLSPNQGPMPVTRPKQRPVKLNPFYRVPTTGLPSDNRVRAGTSAVQNFLVPIFVHTHRSNRLFKVNKRHRLVRTSMRTRWTPRPHECNIKNMKLM